MKGRFFAIGLLAWSLVSCSTSYSNNIVNENLNANDVDIDEDIVSLRLGSYTEQSYDTYYESYCLVKQKDAQVMKSGEIFNADDIELKFNVNLKESSAVSLDDLVLVACKKIIEEDDQSYIKIGSEITPVKVMFSQTKVQVDNYIFFTIGVFAENGLSFSKIYGYDLHKESFFSMQELTNTIAILKVPN